MKRIPPFVICLFVTFGILAGAKALCMQRINGFEVYTTEDGLGSGTVERIAISSDGCKWFACQGGLTAFNEVSWRQYSGASYSQGLAIDSSGTVWTCRDLSIYYLPLGADDFEDFPFSGIFLGDFLTKLAFDAEDRLWIGGCGDLGLFSYHPEDPSWPSFPSGWEYHDFHIAGDDPLIIADIACSATGTVWCATNYGLFRGRCGAHGWDWDEMDSDGLLPGCAYPDSRSPRLVGVSRDGRTWARALNATNFLVTSLCVTSDDGETWSPVDIPETPEGWRTYPRSVCAVDLPGVEGLWLGVDYTDASGLLWEGAGAFWVDLSCDEWTWVPSWTAADFYDIAVDPNTGDAWFATGGAGVGVLRGWHKRETLPIFLFVGVGSEQFASGAEQTISVDLLNSADRTVDLYVALEAPGGAMYFYPSWSGLAEPFLTGIHIPAQTHVQNCPLFTITLPDLPEGTYRWFAACTYAGTMEFASNIASCEWNFSSSWQLAVKDEGIRRQFRRLY